MKKIIVSLAALFVFASHGSAQMKNAPTRSIISSEAGSKIEIISDPLKIKQAYTSPVAPGLVLGILKNYKGGGVSFNFFVATPEEGQFLKSQVYQKNNIQILLDDDQFVGYNKIIIY